MLILGIDPGTATTGWGIIKTRNLKFKVKNLELVDYGCIVTPKGQEMGKRLLQLRKELKKLLRQQKPNIVAIEEHFFGINARTAITVAQARGVILEAVSSTKIPVVEHQGLQVKKALTGNGHADKKTIEKKVLKFLGKRKLAKPENGFIDDAVDGLALAIYQAITQRTTF